MPEKYSNAVFFLEIDTLLDPPFKIIKGKLLGTRREYIEVDDSRFLYDIEYETDRFGSITIVKKSLPKRFVSKSPEALLEMISEVFLNYSN